MKCFIDVQKLETHFLDCSACFIYTWAALLLQCTWEIKLVVRRGAWFDPNTSKKVKVQKVGISFAKMTALSFIRLSIVITSIEK